MDAGQPESSRPRCTHWQRLQGSQLGHGLHRGCQSQGKGRHGWKKILAVGLRARGPSETKESEEASGAEAEKEQPGSDRAPRSSPVRPGGRGRRVAAGEGEGKGERAACRGAPQGWGQPCPRWLAAGRPGRTACFGQTPELLGAWSRGCLRASRGPFHPGGWLGKSPAGSMQNKLKGNNADLSHVSRIN